MTIKILIVLLCLAPALYTAQHITIDRNEGYRKLTWADFKGAPDTSSTLTALTHCNISWQVDTERPRADKTTFPPLQVTVNFAAQSWVNHRQEPTAEALRHEQGHFDIAVLCAAELQQKFNEASFNKFETALPQITTMYRETMEKYARMRSKYAIATANGKYAATQTEWEGHLAKELGHYMQAPTGR